MTKIDRYVLTLFLRTVIICFCSLAGIFVVFHAFTSMEDLLRQAEKDGGLIVVMGRYYGPYLLLLFDWTGAIIALMSFLFTIGWLRGTRELTAMLSAGVSHGRIFRPILIASFLLLVLQLLNREFLLPQYRDVLLLKAKDLSGEYEQPIRAQYDTVNRILIDGRALRAQSQTILDPNFRLDGDYSEFGEVLVGETATWYDSSLEHGSGYLIEGVQRPEQVEELKSVGFKGRYILLTGRDQAWLNPGQCFFTTTLHPDFLQTKQSAIRMASILELVSHVRNPSVHSSMALRVLLHERLVRLPLDYILILLGLPMILNRNERNLFVMIAAVSVTVLVFFAIKTASGAMGGSGYLLSPMMAAWMPLILLGPFAYVRLRETGIQ
ncbi:LptF/LptG family permease [Rubripirellula sp.]|nr:LptF/LptG family permease [Rhodopirellula sp.]MDA9840351.1 LptF/LptG family permease [Rubripirellula sp.]